MKATASNNADKMIRAHTAQHFAYSVQHEWSAKVTVKQVVISNKDVADSQQCKDLIKSAQRLAPLGGIFHLAMVLKDTLFAHIVSPSAQHPGNCMLLPAAEIPFGHQSACTFWSVFGTAYCIGGDISCGVLRRRDRNEAGRAGASVAQHNGL